MFGNLDNNALIAKRDALREELASLVPFSKDNRFAKASDELDHVMREMTSRNLKRHKE